jgi:hypothetical protein
MLFAPIAIAAGLVAGQLSKKAFDLIWSRISDEEAPRPDQRPGRLAGPRRRTGHRGDLPPRQRRRRPRHAQGLAGERGRRTRRPARILAPVLRTASA